MPYHQYNNHKLSSGSCCHRARQFPEDCRLWRRKKARVRCTMKRRDQARLRRGRSRESACCPASARLSDIQLREGWALRVRASCCSKGSRRSQPRLSDNSYDSPSIGCLAHTRELRSRRRAWLPGFQRG